MTHETPDQHARLDAAIEAALALADAAGASEVALHLSRARDALAGRQWRAADLLTDDAPPHSSDRATE